MLDPSDYVMHAWRVTGQRGRGDDGPATCGTVLTIHPLAESEEPPPPRAYENLLPPRGDRWEHSPDDQTASFDPGPPLLVQLAMPLLETLLVRFLRNGMIGRVESPGSFIPRAWSLESADEVRDFLSSLRTEAAIDDSDDLYPLAVWMCPKDAVEASNELITQYADQPDDQDLWDILMRSGIVAITIAQRSFHVSLGCEMLGQLQQWVREALRDIDLASEWYE